MEGDVGVPSSCLRTCGDAARVLSSGFLICGCGDAERAAISRFCICGDAGALLAPFLALAVVLAGIRLTNFTRSFWAMIWPNMLILNIFQNNKHVTNKAT